MNTIENGTNALCQTLVSGKGRHELIRRLIGLYIHGLKLSAAEVILATLKRLQGKYYA